VILLPLFEYFLILTIGAFLCQRGLEEEIKK